MPIVPERSSQSWVPDFGKRTRCRSREEKCHCYVVNTNGYIRGELPRTLLLQLEVRQRVCSDNETLQSANGVPDNFLEDQRVPASIRRPQEEALQPSDPRIPDPKKQFTLNTDASQKAIGSVLSQVDNGQEKVITYFSRIQTRPEQHYCITRKELHAVVKSIKHFHKYLYDQKFMLRTDHSALQWLLNFKDLHGQVAH